MEQRGKVRTLQGSGKDSNMWWGSPGNCGISGTETRNGILATLLHYARDRVRSEVITEQTDKTQKSYDGGESKNLRTGT